MAGALALVEAALVQEAAAVPEMPPHDHDLLHGQGAHRCPLAPRLLAPPPLTAQNLGLALPRRRNHQVEGLLAGLGQVLLLPRPKKWP